MHTYNTEYRVIRMVSPWYGSFKSLKLCKLTVVKILACGILLFETLEQIHYTEL